MGVSYRFVTVIGFEVPLSFLYAKETRKVSQGRECGHPAPSDAKHCPECGVMRLRVVEIECTRILREDFRRESLRTGGFVEYFHNCCGEKTILAGWQLSVTGEYSQFHELSNIPPIDRAALEQCLADQEIPFNPDSWGVHTIVEAS